MIAVDWGTSNFRVFRLKPGGDIGERRSAPHGILHVKEGRFAEALLAEVGDWIEEGERHILLSGMVGSRQGWLETRYLACPAGIADLAESAVRVPFSHAEVQLIPGVIGPDDNGVPEVMRGEETETMGMLDTCGGTGLVCFPGSHSKWIRVEDYKIASFSTCMTGELYAALRQCTILGRTMATQEAVDDDAFLRGVARSADAGGLLHHLFGVRTLTLMNQLKQEASASYLSGLLVGHEVRSSMPPSACVHLVGSEPLCLLYARAIEICGGSARMESRDAAARGLAAIGARLTWN